MKKNNNNNKKGYEPNANFDKPQEDLNNFILS